MCANMKELQTVSEKIFELEQKKAKKPEEFDILENLVERLENIVTEDLYSLFRGLL